MVVPYSQLCVHDKDYLVYLLVLPADQAILLKLLGLKMLENARKKVFEVVITIFLSSHGYSWDLDCEVERFP